MGAPGVKWMSPGAEGGLRAGRMRIGIVKRERERIVPVDSQVIGVFLFGIRGVVAWSVRT